MLIRPSDIRTLALDIDLPSALLFNRLGAPLLCEYVDATEPFDLRVEFREESAPSGLGGRLLMRLSPRGGWGNELMLTVLRNVRTEELLMAEAVRGCGRAEVGAGVVGGRKPAEGALRPLFEFGVDGALEAVVGMPPVLFLVFGTGRAGSAMVGGPFDGRAGRGRVAISLNN